MKRDPLEVLGVARESGPEEWKRAYRRLAMRWHPDRNPDPHATERFKEIGAAYEALLAGEVAEIATADASTAEAAEATPAQPQAADIRRNLELDLVEAALGCHKTIEIIRRAPCGNCAGSGEAGIARTRFCGSCHGSGRIRDAARVLIECPDCAGRGVFRERICPECQGEGATRQQIALEIAIPPGMLAGNDLRLAGQGESGDEHQAAGDLYLTIVLRSHPHFTLQGRDLHCRVPVGFIALLAGGEIEVPTLQGWQSVTLAAGDCSERTLRLQGQGYPGRGKQAAGDLVLTLQPVFPASLDASQRRQLLAVHRSLQAAADEHLPEIAAWRRSFDVKSD